MITTICPHCDRSITAQNKYANQRVKCPGCKFTVRIPALFDIDEPAPPPQAPRPQPPEPEPEKRVFGVPVIIGVAFLCLILGYFGGRWHFGYQIRSAFAGIGEAMDDFGGE